MTETDHPDHDPEAPGGRSGTSSRWGDSRPSTTAPGSPREVAAPRTGASQDRTPNLTEVRVITQQAVIDQGGVRPLRALILHPRLALGIFAAMLVAGLAYGITAPTEYTAEVDMIVGRLDVPVEALQGVVDANEELAQNYSRLLSDPDLVDQIAGLTGLTPAQVRSQVSASQVVSTPFIRVTGAASSDAAARQLTSIAAEGLRDAANSYGEPLTSAEDLLAQLDIEREALATARAKVESADLAIASSQVSGDALQALIDQKWVDQGEVDRLQFSLATLESQYTEALRNGSTEDLVRITSDVRDLGSNRIGSLSLGIAVGLLGGIVVAVGSVTLLELIRVAQVDPTRVGATG